MRFSLMCHRTDKSVRLKRNKTMNCKNSGHLTSLSHIKHNISFQSKNKAVLTLTEVVTC